MSPDTGNSSDCGGRAGKLEYRSEIRPAGPAVGRWLAFAACGVVVLGFVGVFGGGYLFSRALLASYRKQQRVMLYRTNQQTIEDECRRIWTAFGSGTPSSPERALARGDSRIPPTIRSLDPNWVSIYRSGVNVEFGGADNHYGFEATFSDAPDPGRPRWTPSTTSRQTAPHLWYYCETGIVGP